ncbi:MAG: cytochrome B [Candidatus Schekmanbacteria bacterium RBG_13_48_7]|uniref:Cytochrome B n=1 Tax=Candidatus Schekmanbacteria bacterium RBG_13_48_7 TaxID=1817878 RepID=A0A1F7RU24_9BACT|nr:MAG: cytochrome B [Candidatus Schekmanbacteria bacterium RBG_13_48_7]
MARIESSNVITGIINKVNTPIRKVYEWVLHWAETPYGEIALFILAFAESSFFPVPPDILLIALGIAVQTKAFRLALVCSIASIIGGMAGYSIGYFLWYIPRTQEFTSIAKFFFNYIPGFTHELFYALKEKYDLYNFWIVFTAGFTPIPYKVITITAGVFKINFPLFLIASAIGRSARFFLVGTIIYFYGDKAKQFIDKYFNMLSILFVILLILGFFILKYIF